jgi:hypothetical protein
MTITNTKKMNEYIFYKIKNSRRALQEREIL